MLSFHRIPSHPGARCPGVDCGDGPRSGHRVAVRLQFLVFRVLEPLLEGGLVPVANGVAALVVLEETGVGEFWKVQVSKLRPDGLAVLVGYPIDLPGFVLESNDGVDEFVDIGDAVDPLGETVQDVPSPPVRKEIEDQIEGWGLRARD